MITHIYKYTGNAKYLSFENTEEFRPIGRDISGCGVFLIQCWIDDDYGQAGVETHTVLYGPEEPIDDNGWECPF